MTKELPKAVKKVYREVDMRICFLALMVTSITGSSIHRATQQLSKGKVDFVEDKITLFDKTMPHPNNIRKTLNAWPRYQIASRFRKITKLYIKELKRSPLYKKLHGKKGKRKLAGAFDLTEVRYFGRDKSLTEHSRGRGAGYRVFLYLTLQIVCPGLTLVLDVQPIFDASKVGKTMSKMLKRAKVLGIDVDPLYLDRGFYNLETLEQLKSHFPKKDVILPVIRNARIKNAMQKWYNEHGYKAGEIDMYIGDEKKRMVEFKLIFRPLTKEEKAKRWNDNNKRWKKRPVDEDGNELAYVDFLYFCLPKPPQATQDHLSRFNQLLDDYRRRWVIETGFKVTKGVWGWTTSTHYSLRFWLMWSAVLLYNTWILENVKLLNSQLYRLEDDYQCCIPGRTINPIPEINPGEYPHRPWIPQPVEPMYNLCDVVQEFARIVIQYIVSGVDPPPAEKLIMPV